MVAKCKDCIFCIKFEDKYLCTIDECNDEIEDEEEISFCAWFKLIR